MLHRLQRVLAGPLAAFVFNATTLPATAFAQWDDDDDFFFDEEETLDFSDEWDSWEEDDGWGDDGWGDDSWDTAPAQTTPSQPARASGPPRVTGLFVPGAALDPATADRLTATLMNQLGEIETVIVVANDSLRQEFEIMGAELAFECAFDPVCLGRYGRQLGIDKVVVARVDVRDGDWGTTLDLMDTARSTIENYRFYTTASNVGAVENAMNPQLRNLFGLRRQVMSSAGRSGPSTFQTVAAWSTLGLGLGALGAGIAFGLKASSTQSDLEACNPVGQTASGFTICEFTQRDARALIDDGRSNALMSNIFLGTGLFLIVGSVLLFTITPGSDIDEDAGLAASPRGFRLTPAVSAEGFGLSGDFRF